MKPVTTEAQVERLMAMSLTELQSVPMLVTAITWLSASWLVVSLRVYVRTHMIHSFGWDDWFMLFAMVSRGGRARGRSVLEEQTDVPTAPPSRLPPPESLIGREGGWGSIASPLVTRGATAMALASNTIGPTGDPVEACQNGARSTNITQRRAGRALQVAQRSTAK